MRGLWIVSLIAVGCSPPNALVEPVGTAASALITTSPSHTFGLPDPAQVPPMSDFGTFLGSAGDVNGDGFGDAWVSDPEWPASPSDEGVIAVYYGGPDGLDLANAWSWNGVDVLGTLRTAAAGDVDGDGYSDLAVTKAWAVSGSLLLFSGSESGLEAEPSWSYVGVGNESENATLGMDVAMGDFNADGFSDLVAAAQSMDIPSSNDGGCLLFLGGPSGLGSTPSQVLTLNPGGHLFCGAVANAGDVHGDGYPDLLVGDPENTSGGARLFSGSASGLVAAPGWLRPGITNARVGQGVAGLGDINGDGFADVGVSAVGLEVYLGSPSGLGSSPYRTLDATGLFHATASLGDLNGDGYGDFATGSGSVDVYLGGPGGPSFDPDASTAQTNDNYFFGHAVGGTDLDGDGFSEVLVGEADSPAIRPGNYGGGAAHLFPGSASGRAESPSWTITGTQNDAGFGASVAADGDLNGDGYDDLLIGVPYYDDLGAGTVLGFLMGPNGVVTELPRLLASWDTGHLGAAVAFVGDTDGDGYDDFVVGTPERGNLEEGQADWGAGGPSGWGGRWTTFNGIYGDLGLGGAVAGAGDVNADGYADFLIGAERHSVSNTQYGAAHLWLGGPGEPGPLPDWTVVGTVAGGEFGASVSSAGDVNADGFDDVVIGAPVGAASLLGEGTVSLFLGSAAGLGASAELVYAGGQAGAAFGQSAVGIGDVDGDGFPEIAVGAPLYDGRAVDGGGAFWFAGADPPVAGVPLGFDDTDVVGVRFGEVVRAAGDSDGDGQLEIAVSAPEWDSANVGLVRTIEPATGETWETGGLLADGLFGAGLGGGDIDGDGFSDLVIGRPNLGTGTPGSVEIYAGNRGDRDDPPLWTQRAEARHPGTSDRIAPGSRSADQFGFDVRVFASSPYGRARVRLQVEAKPVDVPFDAAVDDLDTQADWTEVGCTQCVDPPVQELTLSVSGLAPDTAVHWRARILYDPAQAWPVLTSRWFCGGRLQDCEGIHLRTALEDGDGDGWPELGVPPDCDDTTAATHPGALEACDAVDQDCDGDIDEDFDVDGDGVTTCGPLGDGVGVDCADGDAAVFPGAAEICDAVDQDCDGDVDEGFDSDGDSVTTCGPDGIEANADDDCNDADASISPLASELCDAVDSDCDGSVADAFPNQDSAGPNADDLPDCVDEDDDGDGDPDDTDCAPLDPTIYTSAPELCDTIDSDCDGTFVDGFTNSDPGGPADLPDCTDDDDDDDGSLDGDDCAPLDPAIFPGAPEYCDEVDSDCDGDVADGFADFDADGTLDCLDPDIDGDGHLNDPDCDDFDPTVYPAQPEVCDGLDTDCDGSIPADEDDDDLDGHMPCNGDCNDLDGSISPDGIESCNGDDDDCDGAIDEDLGAQDWFRDDDGDGFGDVLSPHPGNPLCEAVDGYVTDFDDCDDGDADVRPGATEVCNDVDDNCQDGVDEGAERQDWYVDSDGDGWPVDVPHPGNPLCEGPEGYALLTDPLDCRDDLVAVNPGAEEEQGNSLDEDCDGVVDRPPEGGSIEDQPIVAPGISCAGGGGFLLLGLLGLARRRKSAPITSP